MLYRSALTVAGLDPSGGAGVAADIKTFAALGVHGATVVAALTVQDTRGVYRVEPVDSSVVAEQIRTVIDDLGESLGAVKIGVLGSVENAERVSGELSRLKDRVHIVVDPVWRASTGAELQPKEVLEKLLAGLAEDSIVVPNAVEAGLIVGFKVKSVDDARRAAKVIAEEYNAKAVIVKGGHLEKPVDVVYHKGEYVEIEGEKVEGCSHGTGCTYTAALAALLAKGAEIVEAARTARRVVEDAIRFGYRVGRGVCPVNPLARLERNAEKYEAVEAVLGAVRRIEELGKLLRNYMPEVGMNIVYAIEPRLAATTNDVVGVDGRIVKCCGTVRAVGPVRAGASSHMARFVLSIMEFFPWLRAALNIKYSKKVVEAAEAAGLRVVKVDRSREPEEVRSVEGRSMKWIAGEAARLLGGQPPDVVYDTGDVGKEAMVRVLARDPNELIEKLLKILEKAEKS